jgi:ATP phosphoribosyltransferase regulatory subunit
MKYKNFSKIIKALNSKGFKNVELDPVIETKYIRGVNLKKYLFTFNDDKGVSFSLRPDLSLMSLIQFSKTKNYNKQKITYSGESYRKNKNIRSQIGWEIYNSNNQKDDYEVINNSVAVFKKITKKKGYLKIGNLELFSSVLNQLQIPNRWKQRLMSNIWNKKYFYEILSRLETNKDYDEDEIEVDKKLFYKMKKLDPNRIVAGRSIKEILTRFDLKINKDPRTPEGKKSAKIIKRFLNIKCSIEKAPKILGDFFNKNKLNIKIADNYFPIKKNKIKNFSVEFCASEIPDVQIYSSLVFSVSFKSKNKLTKIINGGRFNNLSSSLGLRPCKAVGAAISFIQ